MLDRKTQMIETQLECVRTIVNAHIERGLPKGALIKQFHDLYDEELIHEETFLKWEADIHDQTPQRQQALDHVSIQLVWLEVRISGHFYFEIPFFLTLDRDNRTTASWSTY